MSARRLTIALLAGCLASALAPTVGRAGEPPIVVGQETWAVTVTHGPLADDYEAEVDSGVAPNSPWATEREADEGLVRIVTDDGRRVASYRVAAARVAHQVRLRLEVTMPDWLDVLVVDDGASLIVVHTTATNAGVFTSSDVYELSLPLGDDSPLPDELRALVEPALERLATP